MIELPDNVGLVLDLDDTLFSERAFHESGFAWIAQLTDLDPQGSEIREAKRALRANERPLDVLSAATGIAVERLLEWHRSHPPDISLYPDAARFLEQAKRRGVPLILLTDGRSATQRSKITALGLADVFDAILISEETGCDKHDANAWLAAGNRLKDRRAVASFGDNPAKDVAHPTHMGWHVLLMEDRGDNVHSQVGPLPSRTTRLRSFDEVQFAAC